jgi:HNH endonuclease
VTYVSVALRRRVHERAGSACEYCLAPEATALFAHEVDHVVAEKHGGTTTEDNLALACAACNLHKGSDIGSIDPVTGELVPLFHPRRDRWSDAFELVDAMIVARTAGARATVRLLQLNHPDRVAERTVLMAAGLLRPPG